MLCHQVWLSDQPTEPGDQSDLEQPGHLAALVIGHLVIGDLLIGDLVIRLISSPQGMPPTKG